MRALLRTAQDKRRLPRRVQDPLARGPASEYPNDHGKAKAYQVRQVLAAIDKKEAAQ